MAQAIILLPSTLTRAMRALEGVLCASDLHEYLYAASAAQLRATSTSLQRTLEPTLDVCEDPEHERQVIAHAKARMRAHAAWLRATRAERPTDPGGERPGASTGRDSAGTP